MFHGAHGATSAVRHCFPLQEARRRIRFPFPHSSHLNMTNKSSQSNLLNDKKSEHKGAVIRFVNELVDDLHTKINCDDSILIRNSSFDLARVITDLHGVGTSNLLIAKYFYVTRKTKGLGIQPQN